MIVPRQRVIIIGSACDNSLDNYQEVNGPLIGESSYRNGHLGTAGEWSS